MSEPVLLALISAASAIVGAVLTFIASYVSTRQKVNEIELNYQHQLADASRQLEEKRIKRAYLYVDALYIPIHINISKLENQYYKLKSNISLYEDQMPEYQQACTDFRQACEEYEEVISELINQGKDAYLTNRLEEKLQSFTNFVKNSKNARKHSVTRRYGFGTLTFTSLSEVTLSKRQEMLQALADDLLEWQVGFLRRHLFIKLLSNFSGFDYFMPSYRREKVIAAPIDSIAFEVRISHDVPTLKSLIREVTLSAE